MQDADKYANLYERAEQLLNKFKADRTQTGVVVIGLDNNEAAGAARQAKRRVTSHLPRGVAYSGSAPGGAPAQPVNSPEVLKCAQPMHCCVHVYLIAVAWHALLARAFTYTAHAVESVIVSPPTAEYALSPLCHNPTALLTLAGSFQLKRMSTHIEPRTVEVSSS